MEGQGLPGNIDEDKIGGGEGFQWPSHGFQRGLENVDAVDLLLADDADAHSFGSAKIVL